MCQLPDKAPVSSSSSASDLDQRLRALVRSVQELSRTVEKLVACGDTSRADPGEEPGPRFMPFDEEFGRSIDDPKLYVHLFEQNMKVNLRPLKHYCAYFDKVLGTYNEWSAIFFEHRESLQTPWYEAHASFTKHFSSPGWLYVVWRNLRCIQHGQGTIAAYANTSLTAGERYSLPVPSHVMQSLFLEG